MNKPVHTKTFKSGNSVAVRLPKGFDIPAGTEVEIAQAGNGVVIRPVVDKAEAKRRVQEMLEALKELPKPPRPQKRERLIFPDRPGL